MMMLSNKARCFHDAWLTGSYIYLQESRASLRHAMSSASRDIRFWSD